MSQSINLTSVFIADGFGVCLAIMMLGANIWNKEKTGSEGKLIRHMMVTAIISCIADSLSFAFDGVPGFGARLIVYGGSLWLYLSNMIMGTLWIEVLISHIRDSHLPKPQLILAIVLDVIGAVTLLVNFFVPVVFSINAENVYSRGPLFWLYMAIEIVFTLDGVLTYFVARKRDPETRYFPVWQFLIPIIIGISIQSFAYGVSTIWPALTIAICGIVVGLYNENKAEAEILRENEEKARIILEQEKQLEEALSMAESASRAKSAFLFNMSHDIRTPLNAITGFTNMAIKHIDDREKTLDCLSKIQHSEGMLLSLIDSVLELSRIESGNAAIDRQRGDVYSSFASIESILHEMADARDIRLTFEFGDIADRYIYADFGRCMRVFVNIISNAIKYTPAGGNVRVRCEQLGGAKNGYGTYRYTFADNGIGMSEEFQKHVFEQFSREESTTVSGIQGTGIGLSVVRSFVELMGGSVSVQSRQGEGTTFTVILPFELQEETLYTDPVTGAVITADFKEASAAEADFRNRKVLLVEDNDLNREIATEILEEEGLVVEDAEDGTVAVEIMKEKGPEYYDFILMDIQMPKMNGYEATGAIREMYPLVHIPIIALSANAFEEDKAASIAAGMDDHVAKPINVKVLFGTLARFV